MQIRSVENLKWQWIFFLFRVVVADGSIAVRLSAICKLISKKSLFLHIFFTLIINVKGLCLYKKFTFKSMILLIHKSFSLEWYELFERLLRTNGMAEQLGTPSKKSKYWQW